MSITNGTDVVTVTAAGQTLQVRATNPSWHDGEITISVGVATVQLSREDAEYVAGWITRSIAAHDRLRREAEDDYDD